MKIKFILLFINLFVLSYSLKTKSLETLRLATKSTEEGEFDIIRILNINDTDIDNQETRILRRKMKKSDLENFEGYLDSYLNILRKFNKRITKKKNKRLSNLTFEIMHKKSNYTKKSISNKKNFTSQNITKSDSNNSLNFSAINKTKSKVNSRVDKNIKLYEKNITKIEDHKISNTSSNTSMNNVSNKTITHNHSNNNLTSITNNTSTKNITSNSSIGLMRENINFSANIYVDVTLKNEKNNTAKSKNITTPQPYAKRVVKIAEIKTEQENINFHTYEDKTYEKIKNKNDMNEEFIQKQKELLNSGNNMFLNDTNDFNIYKRIINISLSLIVVGLLMGILLGLILVMYLNSRSSK